MRHSNKHKRISDTNVHKCKMFFFRFAKTQLKSLLLYKELNESIIRLYAARIRTEELFMLSITTVQIWHKNFTYPNMNVIFFILYNEL